MNDNTLETIREEIDKIDEAILILLSERIRLVLEALPYKKQVYDPIREQAIIERLLETNDSALSQKAIQGIFESIIHACRERAWFEQLSTDPEAR